MKLAQAFTSRLNQMSQRSFFLLLLITAFAMHFRPSVFYQWDEWNVLDRFFASGFKAGLIAHNEHFLPLFFFTYFAEVKLFGMHYLGLACVSLTLHALNAFLLAKLLCRLLPKTSGSTAASRLGGLMFLLSSLHVETLQWVFEQSIQLEQVISFFALLAADSYLREGKRSGLLSCAACCLLAPFFFGSGLIAPAECALLFAFWLLSPEQYQGLFRRGVTLLGTLGAVLIPVLATYYLYRKGAGHTVESMSLAGATLPVLFYIFCGSQFGTVLRGLGFYPSLELNAAGGLLPLSIATRVDAELFFAGCGLFCSLVLLALSYWLNRRNRQDLLLWCLGQSMILLSFVLPALGRWQHGLIQSLSLRYQYASLVGLILMLAPLLQYLITQLQQKERTPISAKLGLLYLGLFIASNTYLAFRFDYYTSNGTVNRDYIEKLLQLSDTDDPTKISLPANLAPGLHPIRIREIAKELAQ